MDHADDLAQETLTAMWTRDFEFEKEEDFLRVCYGFARRISQSGYRQTRKHAAAELHPNIPEPDASLKGFSSRELGVLLEDVLRIGKTQLKQTDWATICEAVTSEGQLVKSQRSPLEANRFRVRLSRARQRLMRLTGLEKGSV